MKLNVLELILELVLEQEDDVIIIEVEPKKFDVVDEPGKYSFKLDFFREFYSTNQSDKNGK